MLSPAFIHRASYGNQLLRSTRLERRAEVAEGSLYPIKSNMAVYCLEHAAFEKSGLRLMLFLFYLSSSAIYPPTRRPLVKAHPMAPPP